MGIGWVGCGKRRAGRDVQGLSRAVPHVFEGSESYEVVCRDY